MQKDADLSYGAQLKLGQRLKTVTFATELRVSHVV